jgi:hypothetical protein
MRDAIQSSKPLVLKELYSVISQKMAFFKINCLHGGSGLVNKEISDVMEADVFTKTTSEPYSESDRTCQTHNLFDI